MRTPTVARLVTVSDVFQRKQHARMLIHVLAKDARSPAKSDTDNSGPLSDPDGAAEDLDLAAGWI